MAERIEVVALLRDRFGRVGRRLAEVLGDVADKTEVAGKEGKVFGDRLQRVSRVASVVITRLNRVGTAIGAATRRFVAFGAGVVRSFTSAIRSVVNLRNVLIGLTAGGLLTAAIVRQGVEVERQVNEIATLLGDVSEETVGKLRSDIKRAAVEGAQSFEDEFKAAYDAISAGVPARQLTSFLRDANKLAIAGVTDVGTATDLLTTALNAYGLAAEDAEQVSDQLFTTVRFGKTTIDEIAGSIFQVAPVAAELGVGLDQVGAALAGLTASGTPTRVAMTQLRSLFVEFNRDGGELNKTFARLSGRSFRDFIREGGTLADAVTLLREEAAAGNIQLTQLSSSIEANLAAATLGGEGYELFAQTLVEMGNAAGLTQANFERLSDTVGFRVAQLRTAFTDAIDEIARAIEPGTKRILDAVTPVITEIAERFRGLGRAVAAVLAGDSEVSESIIGLFDDILDEIARFVGDAGQSIGRILILGVLFGIERAVPGLAIGFGKLLVAAGGAAIGDLVAFLEEKLAELGDALGFELAITDALRDLADATREGGDILREEAISSALQEMARFSVDAATAMREQIIPELGRLSGRAAAAGGNILEFLQELALLVPEVADKIVELGTKADENLPTQAPDPSQWQIFFDSVAGGFENVVEGFRTVGDLGREIGSTLAGALQGFSSALVDAIANSRDFGDVFKQVAQRMLLQISTLLIQFALLNALTGGAGGGILGSLFGTGAANQGGIARFNDGGPVRGPSGIDRVPAMLTNEEFVEPVESVRYYGADIMEAIRRRSIPRHVFDSYRGATPRRIPWSQKGFAANTGGQMRTRRESGGPAVVAARIIPDELQGQALLNGSTQSHIEFFRDHRDEMGI